MYASLVGINAYHQPGVEAGKKAAGGGAGAAEEDPGAARRQQGQAHDRDEIAAAIGAADEIEHVYKILEHAAANPDHGITRTEGATPFAATYGRA